MRELARLLDAWQAARAAGEERVLATVIKVEGSAYRRPGARMLVTPMGQHLGTLSGGCLEGEVSRKAWWLTAAQPAVVCRYDTAGADDEEGWTFGLGCNGVVHVLLERQRPADPAPELHLLRQVRERFQPGAQAVIIGVAGATHDLRIGQRLVLFPDGELAGGLADPALAGRIRIDLEQALRERRSVLRRYETAQAGVEAFLEVVMPPTRLVVFGAGHDAVPVVRLAKALGWHVTVADGRAHYARRERFGEADAVVVTDPDDPAGSAGVTPEAVVVVMSHSYAQDKAVLRQLLAAPPRYLGQLGPRGRTGRLLDELRQEDPARALRHERLHYPVGLDIGADNPEEIALAILAEIRAVLAGRTGTRLADRDKPIHAAPEAEPAVSLIPAESPSRSRLHTEQVTLPP